MSKAVIVGAGIAGIATGIRLAAKGYEVQIFESNSYPGGKLSSFEKEGFRFDAGPSLFTLPQLVTELFDLCGEHASDSFAYQKKEIICNYFWKDGTRFSMPADLDEAVRSISKSFVEDSDSVRKYLARGANKYDSTRSVFLERSLHKASTYFSGDTIRALGSALRLDLSRTLHQVNSSTFSNPKLVQLFDRYATYNGSTPYKTPGIMSMIPHLEMGLGTFFPEGGMRSITDSLVSLAERQGVTFTYNTPVQSIDILNGTATGVATMDGHQAADLVVSNMDIFSTYKHLMPSVKKPHRVLNQERSSSALIFYWGVEGIYPELDLHNIIFSDKYKDEFAAIFDQKTIIDDPTVYINISSKCQATDAPSGCENWFVMINAPGNFGQDWDALIEIARHNILAKIWRTIGIDIGSKIKTQSILDPRSIERNTSSHQGSLYGTASNNRFAAFLRHPNFTNKIKHLYFVGGSVHPGGGIPLCLNSAKIVSNLI